MLFVCFMWIVMNSESIQWNFILIFNSCIVIFSMKMTNFSFSIFIGVHWCFLDYKPQIIHICVSVDKSHYFWVCLMPHIHNKFMILNLWKIYVSTLTAINTLVYAKKLLRIYVGKMIRKLTNYIVKAHRLYYNDFSLNTILGKYKNSNRKSYLSQSCGSKN